MVTGNVRLVPATAMVLEVTSAPGVTPDWSVKLKAFTAATGARGEPHCPLSEHAVAALTLGAQFSSASIHHGHRSEGRVHKVTGAPDQSFVIDAAGQIAERLMDWTMLARDDELRTWLRTWRRDGGDARRFRSSIVARYGTDEVAAWRRCEEVLTPRRLQIRQLARSMLIYPRHLPYNVAAALAAGPQGA